MRKILCLLLLLVGSLFLLGGCGDKDNLPDNTNPVVDTTPGDPVDTPPAEDELPSVDAQTFSGTQAIQVVPYGSDEPLMVLTAQEDIEDFILSIDWEHLTPYLPDPNSTPSLEFIFLKKPTETVLGENSDELEQVAVLTAYEDPGFLTLNIGYGIIMDLTCPEETGRFLNAFLDS